MEQMVALAGMVSKVVQVVREALAAQAGRAESAVMAPLVQQALLVEQVAQAVPRAPAPVEPMAVSVEMVAAVQLVEPVAQAVPVARLVKEEPAVLAASVVQVVKAVALELQGMPAMLRPMQALLVLILTMCPTSKFQTCRSIL